MDKVTKLPHNQTVRREAEAWVIRLDSTEPASPATLQELKQWLSTSLVHRQELQDANIFWGNNILTELIVPLPAEKNTPHLRINTPAKPWLTRLIASAACVVLIITAAVIVSISKPTRTDNIYITAIGQQRSITLTDGSQVELNTNSQIRVSYTEQYRNIYLQQGEAHFAVAHNPNWPFRVYAAGNRIQAIGTAFAVQLLRDTVDVLVTEGRVDVAAINTNNTPNNQAAEIHLSTATTETRLAVLNVNESLSLPNNTINRPANTAAALQSKSVSDDELYRRVSWRDGLLVFKGETLAEAVQQISRYTTMKINIPDPAIQNIQVGGRFPIGNIEALVATLEENFDLKATQTSYQHIELLANSAAPPE